MMSWITGSPARAPRLASTTVREVRFETRDNLLREWKVRSDTSYLEEAVAGSLIDRGEQVALGGEVTVYQRPRHARPVRDLRHQHFLVGPGCELFGPDVEQLVAPDLRCEASSPVHVTKAS